MNNKEQRNLKLLLTFVTLLLFANNVLAGEETGKLSFKKADTPFDVKSQSTTDDKGNIWSLTMIGTDSGFTIGDNGVNCTKAISVTISMTLSAAKTFKAFSIVLGGNTTSEGNVTIKVDNTEVGTGSLNYNNNVTVSNTQIEKGNTLSVTIKDIKSSVRLVSLSYTLTDDYYVNISDAKYATFYDSAASYTLPDGCTAYVFDEDKLKVAYTAGQVLPKGEPVVLYSATSGQKTLQYKADASTATLKSQSKNALEGTDAQTVLTADDNYYFYALSLNSGSDVNSVGFYWMNETGSAFTNKAHKAYLKLQKNSGAKSAYPFNRDVTDGISDATLGNDGAIYNLQGCRVAAPRAGEIYIQNGRKVVK